MAEYMPGKLLVASPSLEDPNFRRAVVLLVRHDAEGAFGLVLNRPVASAPVAEHVPAFAAAAGDPAVIFVGGPVQPGYAFALGRFAENTALAELGVFPGVATITVDDDLPPGTQSVRVFSGYAGWSPGQLENEVAQSSWFVVDPLPSDAFTEVPGDLWRAVLRRQSGALSMFALYPDRPGLN